MTTKKITSINIHISIITGNIITVAAFYKWDQNQSISLNKLFVCLFVCSIQCQQNPYSANSYTMNHSPTSSFYGHTHSASTTPTGAALSAAAAYAGYAGTRSLTSCGGTKGSAAASPYLSPYTSSLTGSSSFQQAAAAGTTAAGSQYAAYTAGYNCAAAAAASAVAQSFSAQQVMSYLFICNCYNK